MTETSASDPLAESPGGHPEGPPPGPPPWIDPTMQQQVAWRDGDVVISVPAKSGTTWTMNIVHQLRSGGDADFADVYLEVPWLEFVPRPDADLGELVAGFDAMRTDRRRAFKTHSAAGDLPYVAPGSGPDVRYVVVARNPDEALASMRPFIASHSDAWFDLWGAPKDAIVGADLHAFFAEMGGGMIAGTFAFVGAWWPLRHEPNVLLVHYADLKADPEASIRVIADFLGFEVTEEEWPAILEYTSFAWMKAHEDRFELRGVSETPILDPGAMIRKGQVGASRDDGVTPDLSAAIAAVGAEILPDPAARAWLYDGGPIDS